MLRPVEKYLHFLYSRMHKSILREDVSKQHNKEALMIIQRILACAGFVTLVLFVLPTHAVAGTTMAFPENPDMQGQAELQSFAFRSAPPVAKQCLGQAGSGSLTVTKSVDALSPALAQVAQAKKGSVVQIDDTKPDGTRVAYQLTNATVSSIKPGTGGDKPMETVSFNYSKIQWITPGCKPPPQTAARRNGAGLPAMSSPTGSASAY
jgi:type VI protein secretion system component Hcp